MPKLQLTQVPAAKTAMLIRKPVGEVFEAFVNPAITSRFWFTKGSARLEAGRQVQWAWAMYGVSIPVTGKALVTNERILIEWPGPKGPTTVEWTFQPLPDGTTFVRVANAGFTGTGDEVVAQALDATGGFTWHLAGAKAFLEHGLELNLVRDRYPKGVEGH